MSGEDQQERETVLGEMEEARVWDGGLLLLLLLGIKKIKKRGAEEMNLAIFQNENLGGFIRKCLAHVPQHFNFFQISNFVLGG